MILLRRVTGLPMLALLTVVCAYVAAKGSVVDHLCVAFLAPLADTLEYRFSPARLRQSDTVAGIIVLGGKETRSHAALRLAKAYPRAPVILSGPEPEDHAVFAGDTTLRERLTVDRRPRNTFENALYSKSLVNPAPGERWIVVTSALHMPRAMGAFRSVGFTVEPWPVFDRPVHRVNVAPVVQHEVLGLIYYRLLGRSRELLPSP